MKVLEITPHHGCGKSIFFHQLFVGVATGAKFGRFQMERGPSRIFDIVRAMAIRAGRDIGIARYGQGFAMDASRIAVVNLLVTARTGLGNFELGDTRRNHIVGAVTINTERRPQVPFRQQGIVNAVERLRVVVKMTTLAALVVGQGEFAQSLECSRRMRIGLDITVTIRATEFFTVDGSLKPFAVNIQGTLLSARQHDLKRLLRMAAETKLYIRGRLPTPQNQRWIHE